MSLGWDGTADLDLAVVCPDGGTIWYNQRNACGGRLDVDMNASGRHSRTPIENVFWPSKPGNGTYQVYVSLFTPGRPPAVDPVPGRARRPGRSATGQRYGGATRQPVLVKEFEITDRRRRPRRPPARPRARADRQ